jgi:hypothetical protein
VYVPSDGKHLLLQNSASSAAGEEGVNIEIGLLKDETCALLSSAPVINVTNNEFKVAEAKSVDGMSFVGGSKAGKTAHANVRNSSTLKDYSPPTDADAMLGFDLRVIHPKLGDLKNEQEVLEFLTKTEKDYAKHSALDDTVPGSDRDDDRDDMSEKRDKFDEPEVVEKSKFNRKREQHVVKKDRKFRKDDDDSDRGSVVDSIVSGDSGRSSLRIDRFFYGSKRLAASTEIDDRVSER